WVPISTHNTHAHSAYAVPTDARRSSTTTSTPRASCIIVVPPRKSVVRQPSARTVQPFCCIVRMRLSSGRKSVPFRPLVRSYWNGFDRWVDIRSTRPHDAGAGSLLDDGQETGRASVDGRATGATTDGALPARRWHRAHVQDERRS